MVEHRGQVSVETVNVRGTWRLDSDINAYPSKENVRANAYCGGAEHRKISRYMFHFDARSHFISSSPGAISPCFLFARDDVVVVAVACWV